MIEKHEADVAQAKDTDRDQINSWWQSLDKRMREAIEGYLTDDQKKQAAANRIDRFQKVAASMTDAVARFIDRLDPTQDQKDRAAHLAATARESMLKFDPEDREIYYKLYAQLRADVDALLTDKQRAMRDTPVQLGATRPAP